MPATSATITPARPLRICHIIYRLEVGGLENGLVNLINSLPSERFRHTIICLQQAGDFRQRITRDDVEIHELGKGEGKALHLYGEVRHLLRRIRPDLVHTRNLPTIDMLLPARLAGVRRLIHSEHGLDQLELDGSHRKYNLLRRASRLLVEHYITVSHDLGGWLHTQIGIPERRISTIHNGVDTERFHPGPRDPALFPNGFLPEDAFVVGTLGRFEAVKDQLNLVRAFIQLLTERPELRDRLRLVLIGDGSQRGEIETLLEEHGLRSLCWLPGFRDDTPVLYRALDLFVLPSRREGISNTILEAMASGLPALATRVGGNPEIVHDGVTGTLVSAENPAALAAALLDYVEHPGKLDAHGRAGRDSALQDFSMDSMLAGYQRVYMG